MTTLVVMLVLVASGILTVVGIVPIRRRLISRLLLPRVARVLPRLGETERVALEAGTVWWDAALFSGAPDWAELLRFQPKPISPRERAFLDGPVEELCGLVDEWSVTQAGDLPAEAWDFMRRHRFFGMIIPEAYDGLEFSAAAHSAVVVKLASRSLTAAVTVMVPNSLGPGELLLHYGTEEQKRSWLPRLARGEEIPCFALTEPGAGSDAASAQSEGIVCRGTFNNTEVLGMRLSWRKRYITLGPVATVIGLAFRLRDPDHLLGERSDLGITCALIPVNLPGVEIGQRHDPLGVPFQNGPNAGRDVFVPLDFIIGGPAMAGQGWRMLMESLAAGRSISLPALSVGAVELAARVVSAYGVVREQFDVPIGRFEGVEEPLARIAGLAYLMNAARVLTTGAVDAGERPAVLSAVVKAYLTEGMRRVVNDALDIRAGAGICRGPRNVLAHAYAAVPIGITVEGANILTRSLIIYGQGAIRCHPWLWREIRAVEARDLGGFDHAFFGHVGFVFRTAVRAFGLGLTHGRSARSPVPGPLAPFIRSLTWTSAAFALVSEAAMLTLGPALKRREKITGRLADALAYMYLSSAALKRFHDDGQPTGDLPFVRWACTYAQAEAQRALAGALDNLPHRLAAWCVRRIVFPLGMRSPEPDDALGGAAARALLTDHDARHRLTRDIYMPAADEPGLGRLEAARSKVIAAAPVVATIRDAVRRGVLDADPEHTLAGRASVSGLITEVEHKALAEAAEAREDAIQVDSFDSETYRRLRG